MTSVPETEEPACPCPQWPAEDFGQPLPDDPHAVSVWMPCWQDVVDYEEGADRARRLMQCGYPRFFYHPFYVALCDHYSPLTDTARPLIRVLPSDRTAQHAFAFVGNGDIIARQDGVTVCAFPPEAEGRFKEFWQHAGPIISSRQARDILDGTPAPDSTADKTEIKNRLAGLYGLPGSDIYLYSNGMAAIFSAYQVIQSHIPGAQTIQLGFPYLDILKIQEKFSQGCVFLSYSGPQDLVDVERTLQTEKISGVFMEAPTNPLLNVINLKALRIILDRYKVPLIIDDTIGTPINLDLTPYADIIVGSLTKFFCGSGEVTGGSLTLNPASSFYAPFKAILEKDYEDVLYGADAQVLEENSRDFVHRMEAINDNAERIADYLHAHPLVESVWYPKYTNPMEYAALRKDKDGRGYGGLLSLVLKDKTRTAPFYDALPVCKGPSLGTRFTLACPYTLLAHYHELDKVEERGVSRYLIRISIGAEDGDDLLRRFEYAFEKLR